MTIEDVDRWLDEEFPIPWNRNMQSYETIKQWLHDRASLPEDPSREAARVPTPATFAYGGDPWRLPYGGLVAEIRDGRRCRTCGQVSDRCEAVPWTRHNTDCGDPAVLRTVCLKCWKAEMAARYADRRLGPISMQCRLEDFRWPSNTA